MAGAFVYARSQATAWPHPANQPAPLRPLAFIALFRKSASSYSGEFRYASAAANLSSFYGI
jgi:hypothetical protein